MEQGRRTDREAYVDLTSRQSGETRRFLLRPARPDDVAGLLSCIRQEYRESYFKRSFYSADALMEKLRDRTQYRFFVTETEGQIAAMMLLVVFEDYIESASQIILPAFRGFGLSVAQVRYLIPLAETMQPSCLFVHAVTFHDITQRIYERAGFVPVGFRLGTFLTSRMENSYPKGRCEKYSEGILILPVKKRSAGVVYLPEEVHSFARDTYAQLGVPVEIRQAEDAVPPALPAHCAIETETDAEQRMMTVLVKQSGQDFPARMEALLDERAETRLWTVQVTLQSDSPTLGREYRELKKLGFFFTGLKPLCGPHESIFMQWTGDTRLHMEDYALSEHFQILRDRILDFYGKRNGVK